MENQAQTVPEENTLTDIEKAKELFEYEMTDVLLNFRNEVASVREDPNAEYLNMEIKKPEFTFEAPGLEVQRTDVPTIKTVTAPEMKGPGLTADSAALPVVFAERKISIASLGTELNAVASVEIPAGIIVPEGGYCKEAAFPEVVSPSVSVFDGRLSEPAVQVSLDAGKIPVNIPEGSVSPDSFSLPETEQVQHPAITVVEKPKIDLSLFEIPVPVMETAQISGFDGNIPKAPEFPVFPEPEVSVVYPDIPPKPDFSGYIEDILSTLEF